MWLETMGICFSCSMCFLDGKKNLVFEAIHTGFFTRKTIVAVDLYDIAINYALYMLLFIFFFIVRGLFASQFI